MLRRSTLKERLKFQGKRLLMGKQGSPGGGERNGTWSSCRGIEPGSEGGRFFLTVGAWNGWGGSHCWYCGDAGSVFLRGWAEKEAGGMRDGLENEQWQYLEHVWWGVGGEGTKGQRMTGAIL